MQQHSFNVPFASTALPTYNTDFVAMLMATASVAQLAALDSRGRGFDSQPDGPMLHFSQQLPAESQNLNIPKLEISFNTLLLDLRKAMPVVALLLLSVQKTPVNESLLKAPVS